MREEDYDALVAKMEELGMDTSEYEFYLDLRKYGTVPQAVWVTVCISLCQTITLHTLLLRFVQGANERWELNLNKNIEWWWSAPVSPMMVWFLTTCLATAALGTSMAMLTRTAEKRA